jgi:hypothetical protein
MIKELVSSLGKTSIDTIQELEIKLEVALFKLIKYLKT